ncbi:2OG-Fe(II) oxygenase [Bacteriovoracaceae bacterium]|nr:2OG-Fe(II) oxygenase [Bacteriovoracaceae bacterium]
METIDFSKISDDIKNPKMGFYVAKNFYTDEEIDAYRNECSQFLSSGKKVFARLVCGNIPDYVHPRSVFEDGSVNQGEDDAATYRIYQYFHNSHSLETEEFFQKTLDFRNKIEGCWSLDSIYQEEMDSLMNYNIVTKYVENNVGLPKHIDYRGISGFPFLQSLVLLSSPKVDFLGGELVVYSADGSKYNAIEDLGLNKGDVLFFDKSLPHEVLPTAESPTKVGRWTVLVGARAKRRGSLYEYYKYSLPVVRAKQILKNTFFNRS